MLRARSQFFPIVFLILTLAAATCVAAVGDHSWSNGWGTGGKTDVDGLGAFASAGVFFSQANLGGPILTALNPDGDIYLARHSTSGLHLWSKQFTPDGGATVDAIAGDETGNIFLAGRLWTGEFGGTGTIDFGGGPLTGPNKLYLAGFDPDGNHLFSFLVGDGSWRDLAARAGVVSGTGYTYGGVDFGGGAHLSAGGADVFVGCVDTAGSHLWSGTFGGATDQGGMAVTVDNSGNTVLAATTLGSVDFGGGALSPATMGLCLVQFSDMGIHQWSQIFEGSFNEGFGFAATMDIDASRTSGRIAVTGQLRNSCNFGGTLLTSNGVADVFVAQFDPAGNHRWSAVYGGTASDIGHGIAFDPSDNVFVGGTFRSSACSFGGAAFSPSGALYADFFGALYDPDGLHLWSNAFGGTGQWSISAHTDPQANLCLAGGASAWIDFGGGALATASLYHAEFEGVAPVVVAVGELPMATVLLPASPNPFNPQTTLHFRVAEDGPVELAIHDAAGRRITTLVSEVVSAGEHEVSWYGRDTQGRRVASGVYYSRLVAGGEAQVQSLVLVK